MTRVSTAGSYSAVLANIQRAQVRQQQAGEQVSSQVVATDYKGYARTAETLTAMRGVQVKVNGLIDQNKALGAKLEMQATGLSQVSDAAKGARESIATAVAAENGDTLMLELQNYFASAVSGLNTKYAGNYLFSGGKVDTQPVAATRLSDLTAAPATADLFSNDTFKANSRLDENTSMQTGMLASEVATPLFDQLKAIQAYVDTNGPFTGRLTEAQSDFLKSTLNGFDTAYNGLTSTEAANGVMQKRADEAQTALSDRADMLEGMTGDITDVDLAEAVSKLEQVQLSMQAAAQVFSSLRSSSLLDILK
ncbi:MAG: flagellin [Caulobacterales bacterium 68-7]|nr:flagellin [Caulobacterales bacterium]OJU14173.1 MAG: flagellin [Caulobacterales bacterium 68-7]